MHLPCFDWDTLISAECNISCIEPGQIIGIRYRVYFPPIFKKIVISITILQTSGICIWYYRDTDFYGIVSCSIEIPIFWYRMGYRIGSIISRYRFFGTVSDIVSVIVSRYRLYGIVSDIVSKVSYAVSYRLSYRK
jgi:hypothetical protein